LLTRRGRRLARKGRRNGSGRRNKSKLSQSENPRKPSERNLERIEKKLGLAADATDVEDVELKLK